jgi:hypothetical protein
MINFGNLSRLYAAEVGSTILSIFILRFVSIRRFLSLLLHLVLT